MKQEIVPMVGDIVHYCPHPSYGADGVVPALVTRVFSLNCVNLTVFGLGTEMQMTSVERADEPEQIDRWDFMPQRPELKPVSVENPNTEPMDSPAAESEPEAVEAEAEPELVAVAAPAPTKRASKRKQ